MGLKRNDRKRAEPRVPQMIFRGHKVKSIMCNGTQVRIVVADDNKKEMTFDYCSGTTPLDIRFN